MESHLPEVTPTAPVEQWMHMLETVRVYPTGRKSDTFRVAKVNESEGLVGEGDDAITTEYMKSGTWIGERTLRLPSGVAIVFI